MRRAALPLLVLVAIAGAGDAEVDRWIARLGDPANPSDYTALNKLIGLGPRSIEACRAILNDRRESNLRRMHAAKVLGGVGATVALHDLLDHVANKHHWWIAACSAEAVGRIGDKAALDTLRKRLKKVSHKSVRDAVEQAIARLEGRAPDAATPPDAGAFEWVDWAATIEEARARAQKQHRPVLAFVTPWDGTHYEAGYEGASKIHEVRPKPKGDLEYLRRTDPGAVKERALLATLLGHPDLAALIRRRFVVVRLRLSTGHFWYRQKGQWPDPLPRLGTTARSAHAPALVFASPEGELLHQVGRLGVFSPHLIYRTCLAVLQRHPRYAADVGPGAVEPCIEAGDFATARRRLAGTPKRQAALAEARMLLLEGRLEAAEKALRAAPASSQLRVALLGEIHLLAGRDTEARKVLAAAKDPEGELRHRIESCLAIAERRLGNEARARELWRGIAGRAASGPWAARARLHLDMRGPFPREWETYRHFAVDPLIPTTEQGGQPEPVGAAVDYLLAQQRPDGAWGEAHNRFGLVARGGRPLGVTVPRTALCVSALRAVRTRFSGDRLRRVDTAIRGGAGVVTAWADDPEEQVWHLTYALHLELELLEDRARGASRKRIGKLLAALGRIERDGGWSYTRAPRSHTFNTAPILLSLREAKRLGVAVDAAMIARAVAYLERNRLGQRSVFHYGVAMEHMTPSEGPKGDSSSCMRGPLCELALDEGRPPDRKRIARALGIFFEHLEGVRATAKVFESWVEYTTLQDSYRYYFGTWYAARAIGRLPKAARGDMAARLTKRILRDQEIDGSFVDSQMVGKTSSTALAILTLAELQ